MRGVTPSKLNALPSAVCGGRRCAAFGPARLPLLGNVVNAPRGGIKSLVLLVVTLLSVALAGAEIVVRDPDGSEVRLPEKPQRVVIGYLSLAPLWELAGGRAVGVIDTKDRSTLPASMRDLPKIGTGMVPNTEKIASLNPDLVILSAKIERHRAAARQLREIGIATALVDYRNYQDYLAVLELFARLNGTTSERLPAAREAAGRVEAIRRQTAALAGPRVAVIFVAASGFQLESANSNTGNMVELLGGKNIVPATEAVRVPFSYERFLLENPDLILIVPMGESAALEAKFRREMTEQPAWRELRGAKIGRVHFLDPGLFLFMPGPEYPAAFARLAKLLYPDQEF